jgi:pimeloyl-ACP methyl ester carboxylesterase
VPRRDAPKSEDRWEYAGLDKTDKEVLAAIEALRARFPDHVDDGPMLLAGFSLGAILGKHVAAKHAELFPRAVFIEGGYEGWAAPMAKRYRDGGGLKILFACGQSACRRSSSTAARLLEKNDLGVRTVSGGDVGHTYDGSVARAITAELSWLLEGDARWQRD